MTLNEEEERRLLIRLVVAFERIADAVDREKQAHEEEQWKPTDHRDE